MDFLAQCVHLNEVCFLPLFSKQQNIFDGFANVFIKGEIVKSKGFFYYYSVMNNWHWRLLVLIFGIYLRSGFGDDWISQVIYRILLDLGPDRPGCVCRVRPAVIERSDRPARGLTGRRCVSFGFGLFVCISVIVS